MNDNEIQALIQNIDKDLLDGELDSLMDDMEIDMESVSQRAWEKLDKETKKMKKKIFYPIMTASLVAAVGLSAVYAAEISDFVKSLFNQKQVYSTVTEGETYYLETPQKLDENITLSTVIFSADECLLNLDMEIDGDNSPEVKLYTEEGKLYEPGGYMLTGKGVQLLFMNMEDGNYEFKPSADIKLEISGKSYDVTLQTAASVTDDGEIVEAVTDIDWVQMGYKRTDNGVQILTSFSDKELKLRSIGKPVESVVKGSFENSEENGSIGSTTSPYAEPIFGYDSDNKTYEYVTDKNAPGRPLVIFESDAPEDRDIDLKIPAIVVGYDKNFDRIDVALPETGEESQIGREYDLGLQKMVLNSVKRTSETTAVLSFTLNTGEKNEAAIRDPGLLSGVKKGEYVIDGDTMTLNIEFEKAERNAELMISWPSFVINGDWTLNIPPRG